MGKIASLVKLAEQLQQIGGGNLFPESLPSVSSEIGLLP